MLQYIKKSVSRYFMFGLRCTTKCHWLMRDCCFTCWEGTCSSCSELFGGRVLLVEGRCPAIFSLFFFIYFLESRTSIRQHLYVFVAADQRLSTITFVCILIILCTGSVLEWVSKTWIPGGCHSKYFQQQTMDDFRALAALQWQHVFLWSRERNLCSEAYELSRTLVNTHNLW